MAFDKLFSPIRIRDLELPNRVVMTGMGTNMASHDGYVTDTLIGYHKARAKGGVGINFLEISAVYPKSAPVNFVGLWDDKFIPSHKKLTDAVHSVGGRIGVQLWQAGKGVGWDRTVKACVPNDTYTRYGVFTPALTVEEIHEIAACYGKAAARAVQAGYDAIEFHAAHSYLPHLFLSPGYNNRTDEYGGSLENRARFPLEIIREIRKNMPDGMPLFMRVVAFDDYLEPGLTIEDTIQYCKWAKEAGVDVLNVSRGNNSTNAGKISTPSIYMPRGFNVENAARIRKETGMITMGVGRINRPEQAEAYLENDMVDLVAMSRAQIADPEFCNKARNGQQDTIVHCIGCDQGCYDYFVGRKRHISCLMNPFVGEERFYDLPPSTKKKVIVAGGGIGGMKTALFLKRMGHEVTLCESTEKLGGQFFIAGCAPGKEEFQWATEETAQAVYREGIDVRLNRPLDQELFTEIQPDHVVIAIGSTPFILPIPGADSEKVHISHDVLLGRHKLTGKVAVIGGGLVGIEVAEYLLDRNCEVSIVEMLPKVAGDLGDMRRIPVMENLEEKHASIYTETKCVAIVDNGVEVELNGERKVIECDSVVMAIGSRSRDTKPLVELCEYNDVSCSVIGDAKQAGRAIDAIYDGWKVSLEL